MLCAMMTELLFTSSRNKMADEQPTAKTENTVPNFEFTLHFQELDHSRSALTGSTDRYNSRSKVNVADESSSSE